MRLQFLCGIATLLCALDPCVLYAQDSDYRHPEASSISQTAETDQKAENRELSLDDRLSIMAAALDARGRLRFERDCSHLVHAIYDEAGFPYNYAPSSQIYAGTEGFMRVTQPQPGDLVVWKGHVGIVIRPSQHIFFSYMHSGPGTDDYEASYWKRRGRPRFYRYLKNIDCPGCSKAPPPRRLLKIKR
jgi:cell wall-associated NlpC family hydrolase